MELMLLRTFQNQVLLQCEFMLFAAEDVNSALGGGGSDTVHRVFYGLQNLLNAAANVSKALWGQAGSLATERKTLRDSIGVSDDSPLREVTMRNNFEHFDERLDRWWAKSSNHNHVDLIVAPRGAISGADDIDTFRWFDSNTADLVFWSQQFNLQALIDEVKRILPALRLEAAKPHWTP